MVNSAVTARDRWVSTPIPVAADRTQLAVSILMSNAGGGHRSAALSLTEALGNQAQVTILNLIDDYTPFPFNQFSPTYGPFVNYAPKLYGMFFHATAKRRPVEVGERACYPLVRKRLSGALITSSPQLVISVHPLLTGVPLRVLREAGNNAVFVTVVTDPVTVHPAWFCPEVDLCIVATEDARAQAIAHGMDPARVRIIGLPVRQAFAAGIPQSKSVARARLGLNTDLPLVLLTGGGAGIGKVLPMAHTIARRLARVGRPVQMAIVAGRNAELLRQLNHTNWPIPVKPLGFVERMADWLGAADLLVSKAGPGTLAEAACMGVPALVTGFIPGQEEGNIAWVMREGAGAFEQDPKAVADLIAKWLRPGDPTLSKMAAEARRIARPNAATDIVSLAMELVHKRNERIAAGASV